MPEATRGHSIRDSRGGSGRATRKVRPSPDACRTPMWTQLAHTESDDEESETYPVERSALAPAFTWPATRTLDRRLWSLVIWGVTTAQPALRRSSLLGARRPSLLAMIAIVAGVVVVAAIAAVKAGALTPVPAKIVLGSALPVFYGSSLAAIGRGDLSRSRRIDQEVLEVDVASAPQDSSPRAEEASLVSNWRRERLVAAGVSQPSAELLSMDHRFSVHELEQLLAAGCPLETALRILEPI